MSLCMSYETRLIYSTLCKATSGTHFKMYHRFKFKSTFIDVFLTYCFSGDIIKKIYVQSGNRLQ